MAKKFDIPSIYHSRIIKTIKQARQITDPRKKDLAPVEVDFGPVHFFVPRHFGFCYGVENAIDIAFRTVEQNPDKRIFLLSEMIHNPTVNRDLEKRGVQYLFDTDGTVRIPISTLNSDDIVIVPAFGTTVQIQQELQERGINPYQYNTTCPFVEKVWNRGKKLGDKGNTLVIHGKHRHEETRATFSQTAENAPCIIVLNPEEAHLLADFMLGKRPKSEFDEIFKNKCTPGFDPQKDLEKFGVINQTTMLATETQEIMEIMRLAAITRFGEANIKQHFADTSDTLCYATNENQSATLTLLEAPADLALVVGGYNSSNTMHLVELLEQKFPTYHVRDVSELKSSTEIHHFDQWDKEVKITKDWLPDGEKPLRVVITSGASCPDALVDEVILEVLSYFDDTKQVETVLEEYATVEE